MQIYSYLSQNYYRLLSKYTINDKSYRRYAYSLCGCNYLKDDLVNSMYLKLNKVLESNPDIKIGNWYILVIIRNLFLNHTRDKKEHLVDYFPDIEDVNEDVLCERISMDEVLSDMSFFDREILLKAQEKSFRKIGLDIDCHHSTVSKMYNKSLEKAKIKCQEKGMSIERRRAKV